MALAVTGLVLMRLGIGTDVWILDVAATEKCRAFASVAVRLL